MLIIIIFFRYKTPTRIFENQDDNLNNKTKISEKMDKDK